MSANRGTKSLVYYLGGNSEVVEMGPLDSLNISLQLLNRNWVFRDESENPPFLKFLEPHFLQKQVKNSCFYAKKVRKKLWNQQKVSQKVKLDETSHKKNETRDKNFKKAIAAAEMFTSKTIPMRLNQFFLIIFIFWRSEMQVRCCIDNIEIAVSSKWNQ